MPVTLSAERPDTPDAAALIAELDAELRPLYPPEECFGFSIDRLLAEGVHFLVLRVDGVPAGCGGIKMPGSGVRVSAFGVRSTESDANERPHATAHPTPDTRPLTPSLARPSPKSQTGNPETRTANPETRTANPEPRTPAFAELKRMYIRPAFRRRGLARRLLAALESHARAAGVTTLRLETGVHQPDAIALYESCGYRPIPPFGPYVGSESSRCFEKATR